MVNNNPSGNKHLPVMFHGIPIDLEEEYRRKQTAELQRAVKESSQ